MKKKAILSFIFFVIFKTEIFPFTEISFVGYPFSVNSVVINPAAAGLLNNKFNIELGYGWLYGNVLENALYTTQIASAVNLKKVFLGLLQEAFVLENIYSEEVYILNFGCKLLNKKIFLASAFRYYVFKYFYDEYYENDPLKEDRVFTYNFDLGLICELFNNLFVSLSGINIYENRLGKEINFLLPKKYIFALFYKYLDEGSFNFEVDFKHIQISDRKQNELSYKLGISQRVFSFRNFSFDLSAFLRKDGDSFGFFFSFYNKFLNKLGLRYIWEYPVSDIQKFIGNHYIILDFEFGKKTQPVIEEKSLTEKKTLKEQKQSQPASIDGSSLSKEQLKQEVSKPEIKISTISPSFKELETKTYRLTQKSTNFEGSPSKEEKIALEKKLYLLDVSTHPLISKTTPYKEPQPKKEQLPPTKPLVLYYKFPLAHKVKEGETLISISKKYYNTEKYWKKIYEANKDKIIKGVPIVGEILIIPEP